MTYQLTVAWFSVLALDAMDKRGGFRVEAMQTIWLLVEKSIIFWDKLPANF
jgi:hypothetical protein